MKLSQICSFLLMFHLVMDGSVIGKGQRNIPPDLVMAATVAVPSMTKQRLLFSYDPSS